MTKLLRKPLAAALLFAFSLPALAASPAVSGAALTELGFLPGGDPGSIGTAAFSTATGISADGSIVVGNSSVSQYGYQPFFLVGQGGMQTLGTSTTDNHFASAISADGSTIVGSSPIAASKGAVTSAWRWTAASGYTGLGHLDDASGYSALSYAIGVSADGSVVVGSSARQAYRWTQTSGMVGLGFLSGYATSSASGVSSDGSIVVGGAIKSDNSTFMAFRWTQASGMVGLGNSPDGGGSYASDISADGSVIVGATSTASGGGQAFRWTQSGGMIGLGVAAGFQTSSAVAASADGSVVVGSNKGTPVQGVQTGQAFRWTATTGMQPVATWLTNAGITMPSNFTLVSANAVNADGTVLVGDGTVTNGSSINEEAWLARVGPAGNGLMTDTAAYSASLAEANSRAVQGVTDLANLTIFGAHHRSLLDSDQVRSQDGACVWATGDAAQFNQSSTSAQLLEIGACKDLGSSTRIGLGIGKVHADQDLSLGGDGRYDGHYVVAEVASRFGDSVEGSLLGYQGDFDTDSRRHYANGGNIDSSSSSPDASATAVRARLDWTDAARLGRFGLSPYIVYSWTRTSLDGYTETGGGFPATFAQSRLITSEARMGAASKWPISSAIDLRIALEGVHRFNSQANDVNGRVVDLFSFNLPGQSLKQNWARALVDIDYRITAASMIVLSANGASSGADASWGVAAQYRIVF